MAKKPKEKVPNNLLAIREELGYSQKEFGKILDVSERQICNYETDEVCNLPLDKAMLISKKWNYSLDWIYCNTEFFQGHSKNYPESEKCNFLVDIRDFIRKKGDEISFSIPNYYWEYYEEKNKISASTSSPREKKRAIAQLNGSFENEDETNIIWECLIPCNEFISMIHFGNSSCVYASEEKTEKQKMSEEQIKEVQEFLKLISEE